MKWLRDLLRKKGRAGALSPADLQQPLEAPQESAQLAMAEPSELTTPLSFVSEPPNEGAWLETTTMDGQILYLPLLRPSLVLGTDAQCDVVLDERFGGAEKVSAQHAHLELWRDRWVIAPLSKEAPVFVNGKRTGENVLKDGMELALGEGGVRFVFHKKA